MHMQRQVGDERPLRASGDAARRSAPSRPRPGAGAAFPLPVLESLSNRQRIALLSSPRIVQREGPAITIPLGDELTRPKLAAAHAYYRAHARVFTPAVVAEMQAQLDTPPTGVMDDGTIRAVADYQASVGLAIDGKAGERTLPGIIRYGLAQRDEQRAYTQDAKSLRESWDTLDPDGRRRHLQDMLDMRLQRIGFPPKLVPPIVPQPLGGKDGLFHPTEWIIVLDQQALTSGDSSTVLSLVTNLYHEARHAEQYHTMARMRAVTIPDAVTVAAQMRIPLPVVQDAVTKPLVRDSPVYFVAERQYESEYGKGRARTVAVEARAQKARENLEAARQAEAQDPTRANIARRKRAEAEMAAAEGPYRDLPTEADAFRTAGDISFVRPL